MMDMEIIMGSIIVILITSSFEYVYFHIKIIFCFLLFFSISLLFLEWHSLLYELMKELCVFGEGCLTNWFH